MKILLAIVFAGLLASCGGGEPPAPSVNVPLPFRLASPVSGDTETALHLYQALYGKAPSFTQLNAFKSQIAASGAGAWVNATAASLNNLSNTAFATLVLNNISITPTSLTATAVFGSSKQAYDGLLAGFVDYLNLAGTGSRGVVAAQLAKIISNLEVDTQFGVYGQAALALNKQIGANSTYSHNPNNLTDATVPASSAQGLTGTAAALGSEDGASATLNGVAYTFTGAASWFDLTRVFLAASRNGATVDLLKSWSIRLLPAAIGTYSCATSAGLSIQLQNGGTTASTAPAGGACQIEVTAVTGTTITGRFSATLINGLTGAVFGSTTDGFFRIATTTGTPAASGTSGVSFDIAGTTYSYSAVSNLGFEIYSGVLARPGQNTSPGFPQGVQIHTVPSVLGTHACVQGVSYRDMNIWFYWNSKWYYAGNRQTPAAPLPAAAQCTVTVTSLLGANGKGTFAGTFGGKFYADDGSNITVSNGNFTLIVP